MQPLQPQQQFQPVQPQQQFQPVQPQQLVPPLQLPQQTAPQQPKHGDTNFIPGKVDGFHGQMHAVNVPPNAAHIDPYQHKHGEWILHEQPVAVSGAQNISAAEFAHYSKLQQHYDTHGYNVQSVQAVSGMAAPAPPP